MVFQMETDLELVGEAGDGDTGLKLCNSLRPDIVIVERVLPDIDGCTLTRMIKKQLPQTQVLGMNSSERKEDIEAMLAAGAYKYLIKDVSVAVIVDAVREGALHKDGTD